MGASREASCRSTHGAIASPRISQTEIAEGIDIRPTIAITKARLTLPELRRVDRQAAD